MIFKCLPLVFGLGIASSVIAQATAPASMVHLPSGVDRVVIPLETADTLLVTKMRVDGHEGLFIVDTGTTFTTVDLALAEEWKLVASAADPPAAGAVKVKSFRVAGLSCGKVNFTPVMVDAVDLRQFSSMLQFRVAGILGGDLLGQAPFEIDYRKSTLTLYDPHRFPHPATAAIPIRIKVALPCIEIKVDGYTIEAAIDTGAIGSGSLDPIPLLDHPQLTEGKPVWDGAAATAVGIQNDFECLFTSVSVLGRGAHPALFSCSTRYTGADNLSASGSRIGATELADGRFTFDYAKKQVWADWPAPESDEELLTRLINRPGHDLEGVTALMRAAYLGRSNVAAKLIERGADVNEKTAVGQTALMWASGRGHHDTVSLLLSHGARADASSNMGGDTALHYACQQPDAEVVKRLLKAGADPNALNTHGWTPLKRAAEGNQLEIAKALLMAGADPLVADKDGFTPLIFAAGRANQSLVGAMLDKLGPRAAAAGGIALGYAAREGKIENVKLLLDRGADPNSADDGGFTALMFAVEDDSGDSARLLLSKGADPARRSHDGKTAWDYAAAGNKLGVLRALQKPPTLRGAQR